MNGPGDIPISNCTATERPCGFSLLPSLGMSCRGRAEAFARHLSSKLRTLGNSQNGDSEIHNDDPILNGTGPNTWITHVDQSNQVVTALQPLRHTTSQEAADSFFDFDCEIESPGSPADECEYSRLIETTSNTPHDCATESGYICSSPVTTGSRASSQSSDGPYFDPISSDGEQLTDTNIKPQQQQQLQQQKQQHINGQILYNNNNSIHTTSPVDVNDKILITANMSAESKIMIMNGHCAYEINDTDEVDFQYVNQKIDDDKFNDKNEKINNQNNHEDHNDIIKKEVEFNNNDLNINNNSPENLIHQSNNGYHNDEEEYNNDSVKSSQEINKSSILSIKSDNNTICQDKVLNELQKLSEENDLNSINGHCDENNKEETKCLKNGHNILNLTIAVQPATPKTTDDESQKILEQALNGDLNNTNQQQNLNRDVTSKEDTDDDDDCRPQRVRRCSSLKTGKTPPGTPGRKKIVRFADVLGLDLADVKTFMDEIPNIPVSAYQDLEIAETEPPVQLGPKADKILMPLFQPPGCIPSFLDMVRDKQVNLENALISDPIHLTIMGSVRVRNLDFHKSVHIRYTCDNWRTFSDIPATYCQNSCDGFSDKFTFTLYANNVSVGQRLEFAVRFQCKGQQFWDNNYGANYCFQCLPATNINNRNILPPHHIQSSLISPTSDAWCVSFY
ncbi:glycogen-binding subunit 76A isoform X1 [Condylostylus longicornis]|uniref:glycogen-binding subunit 76A isoform X1 n=1 Tax=Condylostylus longicornis TaxID=2530218 RepID=UPI00244E5908|nr:glycogen-binding subunit 76A isoform X1 [Condylostylus longicornis]XP_055384057.1 glycogen-binding subunit 76A isoform X1 [Condylostylus longicornis]XP_055384058.1 glycogen-binding subunit 76A isoform X1 [Condylostylus longicornis]XP_055384059.1 glycogen-binding subunit 76A isoform X1 [Condylostylus longicornis]XP_055384060.1 glycogen-binding subunit 76A isoform X1 [Condylostylus longicornis]XP_055384061.1 glycogen-binding subunit 76A isoform X1 [Condylostylus longicornis]XP_055384062.1 gl